MGWLSSLWHSVSPFVAPLLMVIPAWLHSQWVKTPTDQEKAAHLAQLASDAAATAMALFPNLKGAELIAQIVKILSTIAGVPTTDAAVLERAAYGAVAAQGGPVAKPNP